MPRPSYHPEDVCEPLLRLLNKHNEYGDPTAEDAIWEEGHNRYRIKYDFGADILIYKDDAQELLGIDIILNTTQDEE